VTLLTDAARAVLTSGRPAHLSTVNADGSPQASLVWVGLDGDDIVSAHIPKHRKLVNIEREPRVVLTIETGATAPGGLEEYLMVWATGVVEVGGGADLLRRLAAVYAPGVDFPFLGPDTPPGYVLRMTPTKVGGNGPWAAH
jgi:PPOX class probable F420-dependent enzyme